MSKKILVPTRIKKIKGSFAAFEHRFLRDGFYESLSNKERVLYFFLGLAGDRNGISWYGYDRICSILGWLLDEYIEARNGLIDKQLIASDGYVFQVLDLPDKPMIEEKRILKTGEDMEKHDPATITNMIGMALGVRK
ncbi:hypothetical protein QUF70_14985 [Desulfobacterales bacterium HSG17]|nr:hypothetical protein [Desulfobacterales bacterium HSG17]